LDQRRSFTAFAVTLAATLAVGIAAAASLSSPPLREMRWIDPGLPRAGVVRALTIEPAECLVMPAGATEQAKIALGRAVFRSPLLLGGQAARAGVSCASCHRAGRGNPHVAFPGVSGAPGTADVTSSLFSSKRGDGIFNPKPIPDLAADPPKVDRNPAKPDLRRFIHGQIVEEFDGLEPPAAVLDGLAAYVGALGGRCGSDAALTAASEAGATRAAISAARALLKVPDQPAAHLLMAAARSALGRLDERYVSVPGIDRRLAARDGELRQVQALAITDSAAAVGALDRWTRRFDKDSEALRIAQERSLYSASILETTLSKIHSG
jgi:mono/diheme cytochrome c family protein